MIKKTQLTLKNYEHKNNRHWVASGLTALGVTVLTISPLVTTTTSILQPTTVFATDNARNLTVTEQLQIARLQAAITNYQAVANVQLQNEAGWPAQLTQAIVDAQSMIQTIQTASYLTGNRDRGGQPFGDDQVTNATNRIMSYALAIQVAQIRQDDPAWYAKMTSGALTSNITYDPLTSIAFGAQDGFPWMQGMLQQILAVYADNTANDLVNSEAPVTSSAAAASDTTSSSAVDESNATPDGPSISVTPESSSSDGAIDSASSETADSSVSSSAVDTSVSAVTPSASVAPDTLGSVSSGISSDVTSDTAVSSSVTETPESTATSSVSVASETATKTSSGTFTSSKTVSADSSSTVNPSVTNVSDVTVTSPSSVSSVSEAASASVTGTMSDVASATADGVNANTAPVTAQVTTLQPNRALAATTLRNTTNLANGLTTVAGGVTNVPSASQTSQVTRFLAVAASVATANNVAQAQAAYTASATSNVAATAANGSVANGLDTGATVQAGTVNATDEATTHLRDTQFDTAANQLPVVASILSTLLAGLGGLFFMLWRRRKESSVEESERLAAEDDQFFAEINKMKDNWK
ncbi:hypothetical protein PKU16_03005 [Weissella cibaria]|uniref:hypothetical protein n=1 Tax=Weissella cibaria TaxID=137591 RepID=UPI000EC7059B|nr:hypothetical protein [Weissella cibaria]WCE25578.1 hypothetical protein PKU16_03005 [Weissella cibaria]WCE27766.1 hypothetical protein PKU15_03005 [Weissella cibaria]HCU10136.1 hypothetical protein [Weissella cibaria]